MQTYVKKIHFKLHESYENPNRIVTKPPYEVSETGWGEFEVVIKIYFHDPTIYKLVKARASFIEQKLPIISFLSGQSHSTTRWNSSNYLQPTLRWLWTRTERLHNLLPSLTQRNDWFRSSTMKLYFTSPLSSCNRCSTQSSLFPVALGRMTLIVSVVSLSTQPYSQLWSNSVPIICFQLKTRKWNPWNKLSRRERKSKLKLLN